MVLLWSCIPLVSFDKESKQVLVNAEATQFQQLSILSPLLFSPAALPLESLLQLNVWSVRSGAVVAILNSSYFPWERLHVSEQEELSVLLLDLSSRPVEVLKESAVPSTKLSLCMQLLHYGLCSESAEAPDRSVFQLTQTGRDALLLCDSLSNVMRPDKPRHRVERQLMTRYELIMEMQREQLSKESRSSMAHVIQAGFPQAMSLKPAGPEAEAPVSRILK